MKFTRKSNNPRLLNSCQCTQAQLVSEQFVAWANRMHEDPTHIHRKLWEYCFIAQALHERGMLAPGKKGLGFAVGKEPLVALFASMGAEILATDLETKEASKLGWVTTGQHSCSQEQLNDRGICPPETFEQNVKFEFLDMRHIRLDVGEFDFIWSSCALEHLGSLENGERFIFDSLKLLKPGGIAVHTTEYNVRSNSSTLKVGPSVIYRKRDLKSIAKGLKAAGRNIYLDFTPGKLEFDQIVDTPPYEGKYHLKLLIDKFVATSFGLIVE